MKTSELASKIVDAVENYNLGGMVFNQRLHPATGQWSAGFDDVTISANKGKAMVEFWHLPSAKVVEAWLNEILLRGDVVTQTNHREHASGSGYALLLDPNIRIRLVAAPFSRHGIVLSVVRIGR